MTSGAERPAAGRTATRRSGSRPSTTAAPVELSFTEDTSPQLADWIGGYSRWLRRANVTASFDENGITGTFAGGLTPEQTMMGVTDACDMIRQRFEHYEESILV